MKKRISTVFAALLLTFALCVPTLAINGMMDYVVDPDDLLTYEEWDTLEERAAEISQRHGFGVYVQFLYDYTYYDCGSVYETAESLYHYDSFGVGEEQDGIMLLVSLSGRDYALYSYGENAEYAFSADGIAVLEESFLPYFGGDDWYGGFDAYLTACDECLTYAEAGTPVQSSGSVSPVNGILTAVGISCLVALLICLVLKGKMKSVHRKSEAKSYTANGGLQLTEKYDRYTHTTERVRRVEKKSSNGGNSGSSGKF